MIRRAGALRTRTQRDRPMHRLLGANVTAKTEYQQRQVEQRCVRDDIVGAHGIAAGRDECRAPIVRSEVLREVGRRVGRGAEDDAEAPHDGAGDAPFELPAAESIPLYDFYCAEQARSEAQDAMRAAGEALRKALPSPGAADGDEARNGDSDSVETRVVTAEGKVEL